MPSEVSICNAALTRLGADRAILSLDDPSKEARKCKLRFTDCRDSVLRSHLWNFAIKRVLLSPTTTTPPFDWQYQFVLPPDCLRVVSVSSQGDSDIRYSVESGNILADSNLLELAYLERVTDMTRVDSLFADALAYYLAWDIAYSITDSSTIREDMLTSYKKVVAPLARFVDATESSLQKLQSDYLLNARFNRNKGFSRDPMT